MKLLSLSTRVILLALFVVCLGLLGFALFLQHAVVLEPCPMCILQRYAFALIGLIALIGGLQGPGKAGSRVYAALILLTALTGAGIAARQSWLQLSPPDLSSCGPGWEYMVENIGLAKALPMIFQGSGDCSVVEWSFLGLSIANWSLLGFIAVSVLAIFLWMRRYPGN